MAGVEPQVVVPVRERPEWAQARPDLVQVQLRFRRPRVLRELRTDDNRLPFRNEDLENHTTDGRRNLSVDFVGRDLDQRLVDGDRLADLLGPAQDGSFGDRLAQLGHGDCGGHALFASSQLVSSRQRYRDLAHSEPHHDGGAVNDQ
jgi:hypothetical protein